MSQEATPQIKQSKSMWLTNIKNFFHLPNPRVFTIFIIGSTATFSLGIAMIVQWVFHGRNHPCFHWMVYPAFAITSLPILIWFVLLLFAIFFHATPPSDLPKSQQWQTQNLTQTKSAAENDRDDGLVLVQTENIRNDQSSGFAEEHQPVCKSLQVPVTQPMISTDEKQAIKRTLSLPLAHAHTDYSNFKRTTSLKR